MYLTHLFLSFPFLIYVYTVLQGGSLPSFTSNSGSQLLAASSIYEYLCMSSGRLLDSPTAFLKWHRQHGKHNLTLHV